MRKKPTLKQFNGYVEGDEELRNVIFKEPVASQQVVFDLFSQLDHTYYGFFQFVCAVPHWGLWELLLIHLAATASGTSRNRNFCEDYLLLEGVFEEASPFPPMKDKVVNLTGASHHLWYELSDPNFEEKPNAHALWLALYDINPSRMIWEWWLEKRAREAKELWLTYKDELLDPFVDNVFEEWAVTKLRLCKPRTTGLAYVRELINCYELATAIKHRISKPYLRKVYSIARSIAAYNQPDQFFDTFNIACVGLMRSVTKYAPSMAMAFANFCDKEIRYEIYYQLGNYNLVNLPHRTWQQYREFEGLKTKFQSDQGREPSLTELVNHFNLEEARVYEVYQQVGIQNAMSLEHQLYTGEDSNYPVMLKDRLEDCKEGEREKEKEDYQVLLLTLVRMPLRDRKLFILYHNLCDLAQDMIPDQHELNTFFSKNLSLVS